MAEEACTINDWNNDKSDELFFSLLGELLQNNTRATELYTLLSSQANNKSQFQNDNEYRCKEDAMEEDHDESDLNKLVDILKNRLQNGKSVPAGLTQEKLTRLKDDFLKQKEENKRTEQNNHLSMKKTKNATPVLVTKPKPKNKKQLQAEQRRRELEMANIAKELEEKKKKKEEKELIRKNQELERKQVMEEELRKQEEEKKRLISENKKRKEKEEKEKEFRTQKEKERQEKLKKSQEEEQKKKEEEKRRKTEEKTAKQKALKEAKEREEREKLEKHLNQKNNLANTNTPTTTTSNNNNNNNNNNNKARSQQYQQYQQQQQKYPREVPPRFLRQQQSKQQSTSHKDADYNSGSDQFRDNSNWTEIVPDVDSYNHNVEEDWGEGCVNGTITGNNDQSKTWGGIPASEEWDSELNQQVNNVNHTVEAKSYENTFPSDSKNAKNVSIPSLNPSVVLNNDNSNTNCEPCWGASLTGSTWDNASAKQWDNSLTGQNKKCLDGVENTTPSNVPKNIQSSAKVSISKPILISSDCKTDCPGLTPWAGLDSFEPTPPINDTFGQSNIFSGGAKPKTNNSLSGNVGSYHTTSQASHHTENTDKNKSSTGTRLKNENDKTESNISVTIDGKIDTNLKVTGWLERTTSPDEWEQDDKEESTQEDFGWTTVSLKTKKPATSLASSNGTSASKSDNGNAWTNRALKQLLDMGFNREHAEKALRDNNGIIESAVSDLLMKGDNMADSGLTTPQNNTSKVEGSNGLSTNSNQALAPQKLNRKQRRKLQQLQNASGNTTASTENGVTPEMAKKLPSIVNSSNTLNKNNHDIIVDLGLKQKGDGLLPTPPPSLRLIPCEDNSIAREKTITRPQPSKIVNNDSNIPTVKVSTSIQQPIGQSLSKLQNDSPATRAPIGSFRTTVPTPIQPPIQPPKATTNNNSESCTKETIEKMTSNTPLQPPTNPVLLAQMHLQKLGIETSSPVVASNTFPSPPIVQPNTGASSQAVTNSMIQQYLQQIAQTSDIDSTTPVSVSPITSSLHASSPMHLSGILQQAPVPASSLSDGPQKSKLLQWTQPSSACNSEPTTPPMIDELPEELPREKISPANTVDPISVKWGVVAMPRMMPTSEFKPGVQWKSREETKADEERCENGENNSDDESDDSDSDSDSSSNDEQPKVTSAHNLSNKLPEIKEIKTIPKQPSPPPRPAPQQPPPQQPLQQQQPPQHISPELPQRHPQPTQLPSAFNSLLHKQSEQSTVRPPPGLSSSVNSFSSSMNSFSGMKHKMDEMNWLIIRGLSSAIDPSALRSQCQQFGTLIDFRIVVSTAYVRYETHAHARSAHVGLNGKIFFNTQLLADVSTEYECMKAIDSSSNIINNMPVATVPLTNHISQSMAPGFPNMSSFGGLWSSPPPSVPAPSVPQPFVQPSFNNYAAPSSLNMNGGFAPWGPTPVMPDTSHLWQAPPPPQPTNVFQAYPGWLTPKTHEVPVHASIFSPAMDRCLPSELLNVKEHGS